MPDRPVPVVPLATVDPLLRDAAAGALLLDVPGAVVVRHDLADGALRRVVHDLGGVREDVVRPLEHACLGCALREDVLPTLDRVAPGARAVVLALPVGAGPRPVLAALRPRGRGGARRAWRGAALVTAVDPHGLVDDLLGDDLLAERGLALAADDRRGVGEALAQQVEAAGALLLPRPAPPRADALLEHLAPAARRALLHACGAGDLLAASPDPAALRGDELPRSVPAPRDGVSTLDLRSHRPLHPERLREELEALGGGPVRGRGRLRLASRPGTAVAWDGAGGQLSIGSVPAGAGPATGSRLLLTGVDLDAVALATAFGRTPLTDAELALGTAWWSTREDGYGPWLGEQEGVR
ncbi:GTP-binding protein [Vallicoccus soli]|uniref:Cobalamin biosynthesis protein CobW n=1 Tax=Vallicoccus soli TaxID=2339232 RepID=A0A3A3YR48_9ACTN|nr:GTP-binding protein [Vallicoccus soli]RJK93775.1 cobalamin biosynthesis protein CobW [Vallicoccus soli]